MYTHDSHPHKACHTVPQEIEVLHESVGCYRMLSHLTPIPVIIGTKLTATRNDRVFATHQKHYKVNDSLCCPVIKGLR